MKTKSRKNKELLKNGLFVAAIFLGSMMVTFTPLEGEKITKQIKSDASESNNPGKTNDFYSYENFKNYLIEEEEPALTVEGIPEFTILFPDQVKEEKHFEENEYLKELVAQKMESINEMLVLVEKTKKLLVPETEEALCLEEWMVEDACWCTETEPVLMAKK